MKSITVHRPFVNGAKTNEEARFGHVLKTDQIEIVAMNIFIPNFGLILSTISDKRHEKSMQTANILTRNQNTIIDTRDIKTSVIKVLEIELIL